MRSTLLLSVGMVACGGENVIDKRNKAQPSSYSPSDGASVQRYTESFWATVGDDNEFDELSVAWYVGEDLVCDWEVASIAGESFCDVVFSESTNVIVEVRDTQGSGGRDEVSIVVEPTEAPVIQLVTPLQGQNYYSDQLIQFSAVVTDAEDDALALSVVWIRVWMVNSL